MRGARMWRASIPATRRFTARLPNRSGASTRLASPSTSRRACRAYAAAAAALGKELTIPEVAQTVILTRTAMKSSAMPPGEDLETLGRTGATLAIHLSIRNLLEVERVLSPLYGADCPVIVAYRVGWPDQCFIHGTLATIRDKVRAAKITRTALILIGRALSDQDFRDSALYDGAHPHILRPKRTA